MRPAMGLNPAMATTAHELLPRIVELIEPFNKKGVAITPETRFADGLELDSLTVMDFVANVEDEWDIVIPINMLPEIETVGQLAEAVAKLVVAK
jgi:acyl carrier protein